MNKLQIDQEKQKIMEQIRHEFVKIAGLLRKLNEALPDPMVQKAA